MHFQLNLILFNYAGMKKNYLNLEIEGNFFDLKKKHYFFLVISVHWNIVLFGNGSFKKKCIVI